MMKQTMVTQLPFITPPEYALMVRFDPFPTTARILAKGFKNVNKKLTSQFFIDTAATLSYYPVNARKKFRAPDEHLPAPLKTGG
ncbi:MAG: hypothetical protein JEZ12_21420 [Desulfobacterium sp.]|nr:hypothetical protein [Desulfobacterium sp.]